LKWGNRSEMGTLNSTTRGGAARLSVPWVSNLQAPVPVSVPECRLRGAEHTMDHLLEDVAFVPRGTRHTLPHGPRCDRCHWCRSQDAPQPPDRSAPAPRRQCAAAARPFSTTTAWHDRRARDVLVTLDSQPMPPETPAFRSGLRPEARHRRPHPAVAYGAHSRSTPLC
jgi:hypothetical protein